MVCHSATDAVLVVGAVACERRHRSCHLTEQRAELGGVIHSVRRQFGRDDLARLGIHPDIQLPPRATPDMTEPINPSVWRSARRRDTALSVSAFRMASGEYQGWPPRLVRRSARQAAIAASLKPHRQIAALAQTRFVGWPIRQPALLLRDVVAAFGVGLEGHSGNPGSEPGRVFYPVLPRHQTPDPCTANPILLTVASLGQAARLKVKSTCTASQGKTIVPAPAWTPICIDARPIFDKQQAIGAQDNLHISGKDLTRV